MSNTNKYEIAILRRFDKLLNIFLPVALAGTIVITILFYVIMPDILLSLYFGLAVLILTLLIIYKTKVSSVVKVYTLILLALVGASFIIFRAGLEAAGLIVYLMGAIIVFGLLPKKNSILFAVISAIMLMATSFFTSKEHNIEIEINVTNPLFEHFMFWTIIIVLYIIFCVLLYVIVHSIKDDLMKALVLPRRLVLKLRN